MTRRMVYAIRPLKWTKNAYEAKVEYMPGYVKGFIGKDFKWILNEIEHALDSKVPNLSGPIELKDEEND